MNERQLFDVAIADPSRRRAYLADACRDDPALRSRVEGLLESHRAILEPSGGAFLSAPVVRRPARSTARSPSPARPFQTPSADPDVVRATGHTVAASLRRAVVVSSRRRRRGAREVIAVGIAGICVIGTFALLIAALH